MLPESAVQHGLAGLSTPHVKAMRSELQRGAWGHVKVGELARTLAPASCPHFLISGAVQGPLLTLHLTWAALEKRQEVGRAGVGRPVRELVQPLAERDGAVGGGEVGGAEALARAGPAVSAS